MSILLDAVVVAIVVLFALLGLRKGFFRSLMGLIGAIAALIAALTVGRFLSDWLYDTWGRALLTDAVTNALADSGASTAEGIATALPSYLQPVLDFAGGTKGLETLLSASSGKVAGVVVKVLEPAVTNLLMVLLTIVLFLVFLLIVRLLLRLLDRVTHVPVLRQVNGLLGFLLGMCKGLLIVWLLCILTTALLPLWSGSGQWLKTAVDGSYLFRTLSGINPFVAWLS
ncbi:MAG: CvpA family protein [Oscillospiraceae bacterium]|nr:CvpA family protein [Oscillospiraceae bacterium]